MKKFATSSARWAEDSEPSESERRAARNLLELALPPGVGDVFGDYVLGKELGRGSSCVVYRAQHAGIHRTVALKLMRDAQFATEQEIQRFRSGAAAAAELDHPHIAPVFHVGERDGWPFFTMRLLERGNLRDAMPRFCESSELAARMLAKVARAVHCAHQHGVLHRDLKPANIVLDENDEPYVADFGLAKRLDERRVASRSSEIVGTLDYMAPEQASASCTLTPAADIFALGVILHELLTGSVPLPEATFVEKLRWLTSDEPVCPPEEVHPHIDRNLAIICARCLEKRPGKRYRTAEELAAALERASRPGERNEPLPALTHRLETWVRRHPRRSLAYTCAVLALSLASLAGWWLWRTGQRVVRDTLEMNAFIAGSQAGAALSQLHEYAEHVASAARDPDILELAKRGRITHPALSLQPRAAGFDTVALLDNDARILAEWPPPAALVYERDFAFRDYFRGARSLAERHLPGPYIARAFRSETLGRLVFAFSAPVFDERGVAIAVLMASLNARSVFGGVKMEDSPDRHITSALIGPRGSDRNRPASATRLEFTFLAHPGLPRGEEYSLASRYATLLETRFGGSAPPGKQFALQFIPPIKVEDYRDVMPGFDGPWLAAFAPVGKTGFAVLVQTRQLTIFERIANTR